MSSSYLATFFSKIEKIGIATNLLRYFRSKIKNYEFVTNLPRSVKRSKPYQFRSKICYDIATNVNVATNCYDFATNVMWLICKISFRYNLPRKFCGYYEIATILPRKFRSYLKPYILNMFLTLKL